MQENSTSRRGKAKILAEEYNHSLGKLVSTKRRVKPSRKAAFMAAFPVKASPRLHSVEEGASIQSPRDASVNHSEHGETSTTEETISKAGVKSPVDVRQKLQVFVRGVLLQKTLCLQLDPETSVSDLKALVKSESGIQPENQHLYIGRNFQLCDLLSIRDHGIQQDQNIELRAGGLVGGGPLEEEQSRNTLFLKLSSGLGPHWDPLALTLGFAVSKDDTFRANYPGDVEQQSFRMLDAWWKKQDNPAEAPEKLREALKEIGRADLALQVPGIAGASFDVTQCARELAAHYRETMKVTTHPTARDRSREMDDIYVKPLLLQETNMLTPAFSSEIKMKVDTDSKSDHSKASKRGTPDPLGSQPDVGKGVHVQKIPLDSYEDMLKLKGNRLLVTAEAGFGKSTLLKRIAHDWADLKISKGGLTENQQQHQAESTSVLDRYELVFVVEVNRMGQKFDVIDAIFSQILTDKTLKEKFKDLEKYIRDNSKRVLILLDGVDEISMQRLKDAQCENGIDLNGILSFKSLKSCKVIVTSRQKTANELLNMHAHYTKINIDGFDEKDRGEYARKFFKSDGQNTFLEKVNGSETLRSLAEIPLFLWLLCNTWAEKGKLPEQITNLFQDNIRLLFLHKASKQTDEKVSNTETQRHVSQLGRVALEGLLDRNGERLHFMEDEIDSKDLEIFERGSDVGLISKTKSVQGLEIAFQFSFLHKTFQEYCAAAHLVNLFRIDRKSFEQYLSSIIQGNVESLEYVLRFCCGLNTEAAEVILRRIGDLLKQKKPNKSLHRISMLLLSEAQSECFIEEFLETGKIEFPYQLQGEALVAAHYFFQVGSKHTTLHRVDIQEMNATCRGLADLRLLEGILTHIQCKPSLNLVLTSISLDSFVDNSTETLKYLKSLNVWCCDWNLVKLVQVLTHNNTQIDSIKVSGTISLETVSEQNTQLIPCLRELFLFDCGLTKNDIEPLFILLSAGSIEKVGLMRNNLQGLQPVKVAAVPSLSELYLCECGLTNTDVEPLVSLLSAAGNIKKLVLQANNLHGLKPEKITAIPSLSELHLNQCRLTKSDIEPLFILLSGIGSIKTFGLKGNDLHGLESIRVSAVPSLSELLLCDCGLTSGDIGPLFSLLSTAGSIKTLHLMGENLHGLQPMSVTAVPSLSDLRLRECGLTSGDIGSLFSLLSTAGSIKELLLRGENLHGLQPMSVTAVPSLSDLHLYECGLTNSDIGSLFSLLSSAGSIKKMLLKGDNLHGLQPMSVTAVPSLSELYLYECGLTNTDIGPLVSLLSASGSIKKLVLQENNLHGLKPEKITAIPSLSDLTLDQCRLTESDIEPLFILLSAIGSIKTFGLKGNNLHGLESIRVSAVPSLSELTLCECGLTNNDVGPLFSLLSSAGSIKKLILSEDNLHGLQSMSVTAIPSLSELLLDECGLTNTDIGSLFSLLSSAGSIKKMRLCGDNLHGLRPMSVTAVPSLSEIGLHLCECGLTNTDIEPLVSLLSAASSIKKLVLQENNLHGLKPEKITAIPSLSDLILDQCRLTESDIEPLFVLLSAIGSIKTFGLTGNNLHGLQSMRVTAVPTLSELHLYECGLTNSDIGSLFSLLSSSGSIQKLILSGDNLHGLQSMSVTAVPSLSELHLNECGLTNRDMGSLFSLLSSAGGIKTMLLVGDNLHGLQPMSVTAVPSLSELQLDKCGLKNTDIEPLVSLLSAAGRIKKLVLQENNLHGLKPEKITAMPSLSELHFNQCRLTESDMMPLFTILSGISSIKTVVLKGNNLHGLQPMSVTAVPSLSELHLYECGLTNTDIEPLVSLLSAAGSIKKLVLEENNLHGLKPEKITAIPSLSTLILDQCRLTKSDIEPLFILLSGIDSIKTVGLTGNNLHDLQPMSVTAVPSLSELRLCECGLTSGDIRSLFSLLSTAGSIVTLHLMGNNLHGLQPMSVTAVPSLSDLRLHECGLTSGDIGSLFSLLSSAGSIKKLILSGDNLHGLQPMNVKDVPSLSDLHLYKCGLTNSDIGSLFALLSSAGSIKKLLLNGDNLHGLQPMSVTAVPSLSELCLYECGLTNSDIASLFSLLSSAGNIKTVDLTRNNLQGLQPMCVTAVPSLSELYLNECGLINSDIGSLFALLSSAGSIKKLRLSGDNLHGLQPMSVTAVSSLSELHLYKCGLKNTDMEPFFSLLKGASSIQTVVLEGNNLQGLSEVNIDPLPSLDSLYLSECGLQNSDIGAVFHLLSSLGHIKEVCLAGNHLYGNVTEALAPVPTLRFVILGTEGVSFPERTEDIDFGEKKTFFFII